MDDGQCPCRPHLMGRQCDEVQPGFFCMPLDYYMYEAEHATGLAPTHQGLPVSAPGRRYGKDNMKSWALHRRDCQHNSILPPSCSHDEKASAVSADELIGRLKWGFKSPYLSISQPTLQWVSLKLHL